MLNVHCNKNGKKKNMGLPRFEPREYGFKINRRVHYAMEADELIDK